MLAQAIEAEVAEWIEAASAGDRCRRPPPGRPQRLSCPSGRSSPALGEVAVKQPRVHDRRPAEEREQFTSKILPPYLRKTKSLEELIPWLYLKGISTGDFHEALQALLGPDCPGLSATTITRLKSVWEQEYEEWRKRSLEGKEYVYVWADGVHFNIRLEEDRQCILVLMGATADGKKELIAMTDGYRESEQSWKELLLGREAPRPGDRSQAGHRRRGVGLLEGAAPRSIPRRRSSAAGCTRRPTCSTSCPRACSPRPRACSTRSGWPRRARTPTKAFDLFLETYQAKYPKACECLAKDRDELLAFYDFPAEHWMHLRTTNPIESTFATVRLRHRRTKGSGSRDRLPDHDVQAGSKRRARLAAAQRPPNYYPTSSKESSSKTEFDSTKPPPNSIASSTRFDNNSGGNPRTARQFVAWSPRPRPASARPPDRRRTAPASANRRVTAIRATPHPHALPQRQNTWATLISSQRLIESPFHRASSQTMKHTLTLIAALVFAPIAALPAADHAFLPVGGSVLDKAAFTQWVEGKETPISEAEAKGGPSAVVWTEKTRPEFAA